MPSPPAEPDAVANLTGGVLEASTDRHDSDQSQTLLTAMTTPPASWLRPHRPCRCVEPLVAPLGHHRRRPVCRVSDMSRNSGSERCLPRRRQRRCPGCAWSHRRDRDLTPRVGVAGTRRAAVGSPAPEADALDDPPPSSICDLSRDAKGSSYAKSAIAPSRTRSVWKNARFHILRTSGLALW